MRYAKKLVAVFAATLLPMSPAMAEEFPDKAIELVVPYSPGGGTDIAARVFAQCLETQLPEKVVVRNITGGAGAVAENDVLRSRPTGYKLLWQHQQLFVLSARGVTDHSYDDFDAVGQGAFAAWGIFAGKNAPFDDIASMKAYVEANPGKVSIGAAIGTTSHFGSLVFMEKAGIDPKQVQIVSLSGAKDRIVAMMQGNLDVAPMEVSAATPYIEAGQMKSIAVLGESRDTAAPDLSTAKEQGVDVVYGVPFFTWAPKGTPEDVLTTLRTAWKNAAEDPACAEALEQKGSVSAFRDAEQSHAFAEQETEMYRRLAEKYGVE